MKITEKKELTMNRSILGALVGIIMISGALFGQGTISVWLLIFSLGLLYWLFNPSVLMTLVMIVPLLLATSAKK
jgi:uncharacterized membrane protein